MASTHLLQTHTPRCVRFYINGIRSTREAFESAKHGARLECFLTQTTGRTLRQFCVARL